MSVKQSQPWLSSYPANVPHHVEIPHEPVGAGLTAAAARCPDRVAVDFFGAATTFRELEHQVLEAAGALRDRGVGQHDRVALVVPNCSSHVVAFYAALRLGAVVVECNPTYTAPELAHQLSDAGATCAIVWTKALPAVLEARQQLVEEGRLASPAELDVVALDMAHDLPRTSRWALRLPVRRARELRFAMQGPVPQGIDRWHEIVRDAAPLEADHPWPSGDDTALLQYTGGTTGTPKGAVLTHRNLVANAVQGQAWARFEEGAETVYGALPFFHAFGLTFCLSLAVRIGATLVAFPRFDPAALVAAQARRPATFLPGVAPMFDRIVTAAEAAKVDLSGIRLAFAGAMPIPAATATRWESATGGLLIEGYGLTESAPVALGNPVSADREPGTLGLPFPSTQIRVLPIDADPKDSIEPDGTRELRGELLLRGPQVFAGYWQRPEETAAQLLDGEWLRTGDIVTVDERGVARLVDRSKELILSGGFKVYPSQVEDRLRSMPGVRDVAVVGLPGRGADERVAAAVVLDDEHPVIDLAALRAWGERSLTRYALPRALAIVTELPRSQIGKVLRRVVREDLLRRDDLEQHPS